MATKTHTFLDVLSGRLAEVIDSATLVMVLDPRGLIDAPSPFLDGAGKDWQVLIYDGNDLLLRRSLIEVQKENKRLLIVARGAPHATPHGFAVDLSYIPDLLDEAADIIDCSPAGLLAEKVKEHLPLNLFEEPVLSLWSDGIDELVSNLSKFKKLAGKHVVLNRFDAMAVALATSCPQTNIADLAVLPDDPVRRIGLYVRTVLMCNLTDPETGVLKSLVLESEPHPQLRAWCSLERSSLARFLYLGMIVTRHAVPRGVYELERLGLLDFDLQPFDDSVDKIFAGLKDDLDLQMAICAEVEKEPDISEALGRLAKTIKFASFEDMLQMLMVEPYPALVAALGRTALEVLLGSPEGKAALIRWRERGRNWSEVYQKSPFSQKAYQVQTLISHFSWFAQALSKAAKPADGLLNLIETYRNNGFHLMELTLAEVHETVRLLKDAGLTETVKPSVEQIKIQASSLVDEYDQALAKSIVADFATYTHFQRLNTQVLRNLIQAGTAHKERVWIVVLDGLRLDSWDHVVWPRLREAFETEGQEQLYLTTLPSYTDISRVAFLAGKLPAFWKDYYNQPTSDHNILLSRYLGLGKDESKKLLKVVAHAEEKTEQGELDFEAAQYRVLIFNVSDDWIHHEQGSLVRVNEIIKERFEKLILPELLSKIAPEDIVVVTSDHGFIELEKKYAHPVDGGILADIDPADITYRYIRNKTYDKGASITYDNKDIWTLAIGREWFERPKGAGKKARYAHGGISMAEMVVPAVRLRKKTVLTAEVVLTVEAPGEAVSGDTIKIPVKVTNQGTVEAEVMLSCRLSGRLLAETPVKLPGGASYTWTVPVKVDPKAKQLTVAVQYMTPQKVKKVAKRQIEIPVKEVGAKVDIDTSALDVFDKL